jgi:hypothetical protein
MSECVNPLIISKGEVIGETERMNSGNTGVVKKMLRHCLFPKQNGKLSCVRKFIILVWLPYIKKIKVGTN